MNIRKYQEKDKKHILNLSTRFNEIQFMEYRDRELMNQKQLELAKNALLTNRSDIFIAEDNKEFLGYLEIFKDTDYFTNQPIAYISAIAVTPTGEGKGIGKKLMEKAESWCLNKECTGLILDVFKANKNAVNFYQHLGFEEEIVKMVKIPNKINY